MWWYLSYAGEKGFNGAVIVEADSFEAACRRSRELRLSPGGEVMGLPAEPWPEDWPTDIRNRLLSGAELDARVGGRRLGDLPEEVRDAIESGATFHEPPPH